MKMQKLQSFIGFTLILMLFFVGTQSCAKGKIRRSVEGVWNISSVSENGVTFASQGITVTGTYTFGACSKHENDDSECSLKINQVTTEGGNSNTYKYDGSYKILGDKGERISLQAIIWDLAVTDSKITLTYIDNFNEETLEIILTK